MENNYYANEGIIEDIKFPFYENMTSTCYDEVNDDN